MRMVRTGAALSLACLLSLNVVTHAASVAAPSGAQEADGAAARLRALFLQMDFDSGLVEGKALVAAHPEATDVRAWYLLNMASMNRATDAVAAARAMTTTEPRDPWGWFALAGTLAEYYDAPDKAGMIGAADRAFRLLSGHPDIVWMRARALSRDDTRYDEAITFIDRALATAKDGSELLVVEGSVLFSQASRASDAAVKRSAALAAFEQARRSNPACVNAWVAAGNDLIELRRPDEARPLLKKALAVAPASAEVHRSYWRAVNASRDLTADQKRQEIEADMVPFLAANSHRVGALSTVASISRQMKWVDRQREAEDRILRDFDDGPEAEFVYAYRWRAFTENLETFHSPECRQTLRTYIARPRHYLVPLLGEAYLNLFALLAEDATSEPEDLYRAAEGVVKYDILNSSNGYLFVPTKLADRKVHLADAERLARAGLADYTKSVEGKRASYKKPGEYEQALASMTESSHRALGWVLLAQGRAADAEEELLAARAANPENGETLFYLGQVALGQKDEAKAEACLLKGRATEGTFAKRCDAALKSLYDSRHAGADTFEAYVTRIDEAERAKRKDAVLADRLATQAPVPSFDLRTLDGSRVSLESLKGKVAVINFWGTWCGWCVKELPEYQKLLEKYASDTGIAILTIANDLNPEAPRALMGQRKWTFPVLIDDGYVADRAKITAFPTTWFLDRQGRLVFVKVGSSEKLLEEFSWRTEALR
jgi:thiol-disulfide isomerase/thioredoxin/predicted Zn-dependent protease